MTPKLFRPWLPPHIRQPGGHTCSHLLYDSSLFGEALCFQVSGRWLALHLAKHAQNLWGKWVLGLTPVRSSLLQVSGLPHQYRLKTCLSFPFPAPPLFFPNTRLAGPCILLLPGSGSLAPSYPPSPVQTGNPSPAYSLLWFHCLPLQSSVAG
jgi:hypothetical protein